jgi:gamma-glutamylcyclotransferase (GGCT)/AIG2-like uncharacterized protein YtfP
MAQYLFVYGTLDPKQAPEEIATVVRQMRSVGRASVRGRLYDLGQYPGVILDDSTESVVQGELFMLPPHLDLLRRLDEYEGFDRANPGRSLFLRKKCSVTAPGGRQQVAWIYEFNQDPGDAPLVPLGDYAASRLTQRESK